MRTFKNGATRDDNTNKLEYSHFLSPEVLQSFANYMHKHRIQADGKLRAPNNWKQGIPTDAYMSSLWRHLHDLWLHHEKRPDLARESKEDALNGILFNAMGYLYEELKK